MKCDGIKDLLSSYIDNMLEPQEKQIVDRHISECSSCSAELDLLKKYLKEMNKIETIKAPTNFLNQLHIRLKNEKPIANNVINFSPITYYRYAGVAAVFIVFVMTLYYSLPGKQAEIASIPKSIHKEKSVLMPRNSKDEIASGVSLSRNDNNEAITQLQSLRGGFATKQSNSDIENKTVNSKGLNNSNMGIPQPVQNKINKDVELEKSSEPPQKSEVFESTAPQQMADISSPQKLSDSNENRLYSNSLNNSNIAELAQVEKTIAIDFRLNQNDADNEHSKEMMTMSEKNSFAEKKYQISRDELSATLKSSKSIQNKKKELKHSQPQIESNNLHKIITELINKYGGEIIQSNVYSKSSSANTVDAYIPATNYNSFIKELSKSGLIKTSDFPDKFTKNGSKVKIQININR